MSRKRQVLELLGRGQLQEIAEDYELEVADRRVKDELVEAIARSKKATLVALLEKLPRSTLKDVCREMDLDESGREKAVLVERIVGGDGQPSSEESGLDPLQITPPTSREAHGGRAEEVPLVRR